MNRSLKWMAGYVLLLASCSWGQGDLLEDPSFEETKPRDRSGVVFAKWSGNNWNEEAARMDVGTIARTGKTSCLLMGDPSCKIAIMSRVLKLEAGRYRLRFFIRGMDVQLGEWKQSATCGIGLKGKAINKVGTFGWTLVTLVQDVTAEELKAGPQVRIVLRGGGRLWIDDVLLEKAGEDVAVTADPIVGEEESPFTAPQPAAPKTLHCRECGYKVAADAKTCHACGGTPSVAVQASTSPSVKLIANFEDGKIEPFRYGKIVSENAPQGTKALLMDQGNTSIAQSMDWSQYDYLRLEVFNPKDEPAALDMEIRDVLSKGYWDRVNQSMLVAPGKSTISVRTDMYVGEKARPGRNLIRENVTHLFLTSPAHLLIDNVRLVRESRPDMQLDTLWAFDFGKLDSPVMEGFWQATPATLYHPGRGFGWQNPKFWRTFNALQPDALFQDFVAVEAGSWRVDVPNGKYRIWMNIDAPATFWGDSQTYQNRRVTANGRVVVDEKQDFRGFLKKYFRFAGTEVLPGIDTFEQCVQKAFSPKEFDVEVTDGKIEIGFEGKNWSNCLSALVIYPAEKSDGKKFLQWVTERRRAQFTEYFRQMEPKRSPAPAESYALFTRHFMTPVNAYDGPKEGEQIGPVGLSVTVARGEEMPLTFALQPTGDVGEIDLKVSELKNEGGTVLAAGAILPGWVDYRIIRLTVDGAAYSVQPCYWHPTPAPAAPGVTRRFWLRVRTAADAPAGVYKGQVTLRPAKAAAQTIPISVRVLPITLDEVGELAVGPWGVWIRPGNWEGPQANAWTWTMFDKALTVLRADGWTSFSAVPSIKVKAADGKVAFDFTEADKQMEMIRAKGFRHMISAYGSDAEMGYSLKGQGDGVDAAAATGAGFADFDSFLKAIWLPIDQHAKEKNWVPVAYNLCDEPGGERIKRAVLTALAHRKIPGLERTLFMGETSMRGANPKEVESHGELVKALQIPTLAFHDEAAIKLIKDAGGRFGYYNDGYRNDEGDRFGNGRYLWMLAHKHGLAIRMNWHFNIVAGDPYYDLDGREGDACWFNTDENQTLVPRIHYLAEMLTGLNDYRYLITLDRLVKEKPAHPAAAAGKKILEGVLKLEAGKDRDQLWSQPGKDHTQVLDEQRNEVIEAIVKLLE